MKQKTSIWRSHGLLVVAIAAVVLLASQLSSGLDGLERRFYDFSSTQIARDATKNVAVIAIDDASIANIGRWPWSREVHARFIDKLGQGKPKVIGYTAFFSEPQVDKGLVFVRKIRAALPASAFATAAPPPAAGASAAVDGVVVPATVAAPAALAVPTDPVAAIVQEAELALDSDAALAKSIARAGNVVLPSVFAWGEPKGNPDKPLADFVQKHSIADEGVLAPLTLSGTQPLDVFAQHAAAVGHLNQWQDVDGVVRSEPLFVHHFGRAVPSFALSLAAQSLNLSAKDMRLTPDAVQLGRLQIATTEDAELYGAGVVLPQFFKAEDGKYAFEVDSFYDVLNDKIPASKYEGKIVIVGATATGVGDLLTTPAARDFSPAQLIASVTSSILQEQSITRPAWAPLVAIAAFLLVLAFLMLVLPRLTAAQSALAAGALLLALLGTEYGLMVAAAQWIPLVLSMVLLVLGYLGLTTKRFLFTEAGKVKADAESAETNRMMGLALQGQGRLDEALDRYLRVPLGGDQTQSVLENIYSLAMDFERKRQFNKAEAAYEYISKADPQFKDVKSKMTRAKNLSETVILGGGGAHPGGTLILDSGAVEKPMLGRYQVERELGKGAMGVVYFGKDPKIGRTVAIKTMALKNEFEGEDLDDARERFFREAETAGRLQHQNIVTIFDAGEEHDLAYIAMEFLKGRDLADQCKAGGLLPTATVLSIVARVARALDYAHSQGVVHRDIKPANIMYEAASDSVKVTDFGIARITDSSKTKTGLVLGTPSFMSPEQISGKPVDGRSDLYSLGVMLYQMLTAHLPFEATSLTELMFKITNAEATDLSEYRSDLSADYQAVLTRCLAKKTDERYQTGLEMAADIERLAAMPSEASMPDLSL